MSIIESFNNTIDQWISALERYDETTLGRKPFPGSWSLGQVYMHLLDETRFYILQIELCLSCEDHADRTMTVGGRQIFENNAFPNERIQGDPVSAANMPQPSSKQDLLVEMHELRMQMNELGIQIMNSARSGKTQHPGQGWLNAEEWFRYAEMHMRHHLKQRVRIEAALR